MSQKRPLKQLQWEDMIVLVGDRKEPSSANLVEIEMFSCEVT